MTYIMNIFSNAYCYRKRGGGVIVTFMKVNGIPRLMYK